MTPEEHAYVQALEGTVKRYRSRIALLKEALLLAKQTIKNWQHIEAGNLASEEMWRLYQHSPEMQHINVALGRNGETDHG